MASRTFTKYVFNIKTIKICKYFNSVRHKSEGTKVVLLNSYNTAGISTAYLLKKTNLFSEICMQESRNVPKIKGIIADLNNINTPAKVTDSVGTDSMAEALQDAGIVVMMEREKNKKKKRKKKPKEEGHKKCITYFEKAAAALDKKFLRNAELCAKAAELYAKICPGALLTVVTTPINSILPLVCTIATETNHTVDVRKILGFMSPDVIKTNLLWAERTKMKHTSVKVPVIGGSTENTLIPLFSQLHTPELEKSISEVDFKYLTEQARRKKVKAPLATAASVAKFITSLGALLKGNEMNEILYIASSAFPNIDYIAGPTQLGPAGVQQMLPFPKLSDYEKLLYDSLPFYLKVDIKRGKDYAAKYMSRKRM